MQAGAQTGLSARRADDEEAQSADRLRLAYDQLAENERMASAQAKSRFDLAKSAQQLKAQQFESAQDLKRQQLNAVSAYRAGMLNERQQNMQRLADQFKTRESGIEDRFGQRQDARDLDREDRQAREDRLSQQFQDTMKLKQQHEGDYAGKLDPTTQALLGADVSELRGTQKQIEKIDEQGGPARGMLGLSKGNTEQYQQLKKREADLLTKIKGYKTPKEQREGGGKSKYTYVPGKGIVPNTEE
jgi:hypothetical protein